MLELDKKTKKRGLEPGTSGEFTAIDGVRSYVIRNVDKMPPFFISVISHADHWLFISSTGGLTAGRVSPDSALFPYVPVDRIHESTPHTGSRTILRVESEGRDHLWEPFNQEQDGRYDVTRNLYKAVSGGQICFEEINHDLGLVFRYTWQLSDQFGFSRCSELRNLAQQPARVELLDGLQNILPAGTPQTTQAAASNLVDAYKWTELDEESGLAIYTLYSGISDRAEPSESLRANTVFSLGLSQPITLISSAQVANFRSGLPLHIETHSRGIRGAYFVNDTVDLPPRSARQWRIVADVENTQSEVVALRKRLHDSGKLASKLTDSVTEGTDELARIMASTDALQLTAEENVVAHHYANVLFNNLRGGIVDDQDRVSTADFGNSISYFNHDTYQANREFLISLPTKIDIASLRQSVKDQGDPDLERLCYEYLPIRFGRRHGDPSRPWNKFAIQLKDASGKAQFSYQGNWRDIFQNWEALLYSYPEFVDNVVAKFVNASTVDGYNPYRVTNKGIDWEVEEPDNPWSYIGYWGDHQIIYLLKLLELSNQFHPARLAELLRKPIYSYANVPYRIRSFEASLKDPKNTVEFDHELADQIERRVAQMGGDGRLVLDREGKVYSVTLLEKLLVPLLAKLGNLVIDGGIWLNTQRPEWNDANNALVGHGLSMVTLYYMRRYVRFLQRLLENESTAFELSGEVSQWLTEMAAALGKGRAMLCDGEFSPGDRYEVMADLGNASTRYRQSVYSDERFSASKKQEIKTITDLLGDALTIIEHSIRSNLRDDGLYHAYNLLNASENTATVDSLYPMLEGQVAALSSGIIDTQGACRLLQALFDSDIYRADQRSFMLYPDRELPGFLEKNRIPAADAEAIGLLRQMLTHGDERLVSRDADGVYRFNADISNANDLAQQLDDLVNEYGNDIDADREALQALYERVFKHREFTGRSGGMFGFEGLGCIYWHMVSKLLLAIQERFYAALDTDAEEDDRNRLGHYYYRVREGLGFNKTPTEYGAFPSDPYSHTPKHAGAQQPGMTGQVKEEVLSRFGELGVRVADGLVRFQPSLLRECEFTSEPREFCFLDVRGNWGHLTVPSRGLAFTWCQVPIVYELDDSCNATLSVIFDDGTERSFSHLELPTDISAELFGRRGQIQQIHVTFPSTALFELTNGGD